MTKTPAPPTLPFYDHAMTLGRNRQRLGLTHQAAQLFRRLARFPDLPADYLEEAHYRLAELNLDHTEWRKARRHLAAAIAFQPDNAHYHHLMAIANADDDTCDPRRALEYFRRANALDPDNAAYLCDLGMQALRVGETAEAVKALRRAAELAPDDVDVLGQVSKGLTEAGNADDAKKLLRAALFRNPRDHGFCDLWNRQQFDVLHAEQESARSRWKLANEGPIVLPFARPAGRIQRVDEDGVRHDGPKTLPGPHRAKVRRAARQTNP